VCSEEALCGVKIALHYIYSIHTQQGRNRKTPFMAVRRTESQARSRERASGF